MPGADTEPVPTWEQQMTEPEEPAEGSDDAGTDTGAEVEKWKTLARKHEQQAKANAAAAKKLAEIEAAQKSAEEKAAEARAEAERERDELRLALLRRDAAEEAGLPRSWADRLKGATAEELLADAKNLAKDLAPKDNPPAATARAVPDLKSGALPTDGAPSKFDGDAYIRAMARK